MPQMNLEGKRILIVADSHDLAGALRQEFEARGAVVLGPAPTPFYALSMLRRRAPEGAILDIRRHGPEIDELTEKLTALGTPILFATELASGHLVSSHRAGAVLHRPYTPADAADRLGALIATKDVPELAAPPPVLSGDTVVAKLMRATARALQPQG